MEKKQATELIRNTFENTFSEEQFLKLLVNVFNEFDSAKTMGPWQGNRVFQPFQDHINSFKRIGQYRDPQGKLLDVLTVKVKQGTKLDRARTTLRNLAIEYLRGRNEVSQYRDTILVAFYAEDTADWRLSYIKLETIAYRDDKDKVKTKDQITSARRYSFLVGANEPSHTAQKQLLPLLMDTFNNPTLTQLEEAFNIEKVTKEFFEKYRELFHKVQEHLDELLKKDKTIREDFKSNQIETAAFAKKLLGQIVFLYFIQKKGWLGVPKEKNFGEGDKSFLRNLLKQAKEQGENYFNDYLELLFYEALAVERKSADPSWYKLFNCRIPFLNGGLFEPIGDYDWRNTQILIPNDIFANNEVTKEGDVGTGILDVFDRYNFTVKEDEPLEKEVAVDPEMLGKVFENLLEVKDRKSKGTYYTPREIVHYMCQESLINYLDTALNNEKCGFLALDDKQYDMFGNSGRKGQLKLESSSTSLKIPRDDIEEFIKHSHLVVNDTRQERNKKTWQLPQLIQKHAAILDKALTIIKICDPAIGSGAFPVGLLTEIVNARSALTQYIDGGTEDHDRTPYHLKRNCIQNSIYGVDIDPSAIDVAKLRLWLSLVVDEDTITDIDPLPNLDYKIVCGNSLLGVETDLFNQSLFNELEEKKKLHFNITNQTEKKILHKKIDNLLLKITNGKKEFDFKIYFSEVWHERNGFDIVIGNPPYISHDNILNKNYYKKYKTFEPFADLYCYFIERGIDIQNNNGVLSFITSNSYLRANYGLPVREFIRKENHIVNIVNIEDFQLFDSAIVNTAILISQRNSCYSKCIVVNSVYKGEVYFDKFVNDNLFLYEQADFIIQPWLLVRKEILAIRKKIELAGKTLENYGTKIRLGLATGANDVFVVDESKRGELVAKDPNNKKILKPVLRGRDIDRYCYNFPGLYIILAKNDIDVKHEYPSVYSYLDSFGKSFKERGAKGHHWSNLRACSFFEDFKEEKIIWIELSDRGRFALAIEEVYLLNSAYFLLPPPPLNIKYLLGVLNSTVINFYLNAIAATSGMGTARWINNYVKLFPIPKPLTICQSQVGIIVDYIMISKTNNHESELNYFEQIVDGMVFELYFGEELKTAGRDVLKYLTDLRPIQDDMTEQQKLKIIESEFNRLYDKEHPVRNNLFYMDSIPEIRIIKGLEKDEDKQD